MPPLNAHTLRRSFAEQLGIPIEIAESKIRESLLVVEGIYCGRRFSLDGYTLTWFVEENQVKLMSPQGQLVVACSALAFATHSTNRQAAA
jgi:hypothetical protein